MAAQPTLTVAGDERQVEVGTTGTDLFGADRSVVAMRVDGVAQDLFRELPDGAVVEPIGLDSDEGLAILRHSAAHVLAQAVQQVNPDAKLGIGPPVTDGFYYDFDVATPFTPEDLKALEKAMQRIVNESQTFARRVVGDDEARAELADEPYKLELIGLKGNAAQAAEGRNITVQVDGGISLETIERAAKAGATSFVAGSAVYGAENPAEAISALRDLARESSGASRR